MHNMANVKQGKGNLIMFEDRGTGHTAGYGGKPSLIGCDE